MSLRIVIDRNTPLGSEAFATIGEVRAVDTSEFSPAVVRDADAVIVRSETRVGAALLDGSRVKFVGSTTIGTDHVDVSWLESRGIGFSAAPGCNAQSVVEYVVAALLELGAKYGFSLHEKTLGIVGVGNIGGRLARVADVLGMKTILNDPPLARLTRDPKYRPIDEVMEADIVTLHVPLTRRGQDVTYHFFDAGRIAAMKKGSFLVNACRGAVVVNDDLKRALKDGRLKGALLDVWEGEPQIDPETLELVDIGTPHIAGYSLDGKTNAVQIVYDNACRFFNNVPPRWHVDPSRLPAPEHPSLSVPLGLSGDEALRMVVRRCYGIMDDDMKLRQMVHEAADARPAFFQKLRSGYQIRREFRATAVSVSDPHLKSLFAGLGFAVVSR